MIVAKGRQRWLHREIVLVSAEIKVEIGGAQQESKSGLPLSF
jgi:hypothetical protein